MSLFHHLKLKRRKVEDSNRSSSDGKLYAQYIQKYKHMMYKLPLVD